MPWRARLRGDPATLSRLAAELLTDELRVLQLAYSEDGFVMVSRAFEGATSPMQATEITLKLLRWLRGASQFDNELMSRPIVLNGVELVDVHGKIEQWSLVYSDDAPVEGPPQQPTHDPTQPVSITSQLLNLSATNPMLQKALRLLALCDNWDDLFRIYEIVQHAAPRIVAAIPKSTRDQFSGTANHPELSGDGARHGYVAGNVPKLTAMSQGEGYWLVNNLLRQWIRQLIPSVPEKSAQ